jgi:hypothetical protein
MTDKTKRELEAENAVLRRENDTLRRVAGDLAWMARRYCDGRMSYAPSLYNDYVRALLALGVPLNPTGDGTIWARDGMGRGYDGLGEEEAAMGGDKANAVGRWAAGQRERVNRLIEAARAVVAALGDRPEITVVQFGEAVDGLRTAVAEIRGDDDER